MKRNNVYSDRDIYQSDKTTCIVNIVKYKSLAV